MSDTSRKRSRKSKLVPRQFAEVDDDNVENLQEPADKNKKINNTANSNAQNETNQDDFEALIDSQKNQPKREFSITVAVEEFDESSNELTIIETKQEPEVVSSDDEDKNWEKQWYTLDRDKILDAVTQILEVSDNPADKILGIEVRNGLGRFHTNIEDPLETKIQNVLVQWLDTQRQLTPKQRSPPLFYKCYICEMSWWYLYNFREHLKEHKDFFLHLEACTLYESSIVATSNVRTSEIKHFDTEGNCPKCGYDFEKHKNSLNNRETSYICKSEGCKKTQPTCYLMRQHEHTNHTVTLMGPTQLMGNGKNESWIKVCEICGPMFHTPQLYHEHMDLMHSVRSDLVIQWKEYTSCQTCKMKCITGWHDCMKKLLNLCNICNISFSKFMFPLHCKQDGYTCSICNVVLPKFCMKMKHLMEHTDNFVIMQKCTICTDFVVIVENEYNWTKHVRSYHNMKRKEELVTKYLRTILIPKVCLTGKPICLQQTVNLPKKEEPTDVTMPNIEIKQEIIDNIDDADDEDTQADEIKIDKIDDADDEDMQTDEIKIKEEIDLYDNFEATMREEYDINIEETKTYSKVFGIKIEACEVETKQEILDEEYYADDIIKLDVNFLNAIQESQNVQEERQETQENADDSQDSCKKPKLYRCTKCGFHGYHKEYRMHIKTDCHDKVYEKGHYTCTKCFTTYDMFQQYIEHLYKHNVNKLCCPECFREFLSFQVLLPHVSMHIRMTYVTVPIITESKKNAQFIYQCKICRDKVEKSDFFQHWETHLTFAKDKIVADKCAEISEDGITAKAIEQHLKIEHHLKKELLFHLQSPELTYMKRGCLICHRHFVRKNDCKRHLIEHLLTDAYAHRSQCNALKCQICTKSFQKPDNYKKHMRDHASLPEYRCDICDKSFSDSSNFTKHKKLHNANAYTCDTCGKKFQAKISLEKHVGIHLNQTPIECVPCNKKFYLSSAYKKHIRMFHEKNALRFSCVVCNIKFKCLKDKWDHLWYVHKERKHKADCTRCNKSYRRFRDLKNHMMEAHNLNLRQCKIGNKPLKPAPKLMKSNLKTAKKNTSKTITLLPAETLVVFE